MRYMIEKDGESVPVEVHEISPGQYRLKLGDGEPVLVEGLVEGGMVHLLHERQSHMVSLGTKDDTTYAHNHGHEHRFAILDAKTARRRSRKMGGQAGSGNLIIKSPMPGRIVKVLVEVGELVTSGQGIVIVEAMKMENELRAETDGVVDSIQVAADDRVEGNAILVRLKAPEGTDS